MHFIVVFGFSFDDGFGVKLMKCVVKLMKSLMYLAEFLRQRMKKGRRQDKERQYGE